MTERVHAVIGDDTGASLEPRTGLSVGIPLPQVQRRDLSRAIILSSSGGVVDTSFPQYEFAHRQAALVSNETEAARIAQLIGARHGHLQSIAGIGGPPPNNNPYYDTQVQRLGIASSSIMRLGQDHPKPGFTTHPVMSKMSSLPYQQKLQRPVTKLSVGLLGIYNDINKKYHKDTKERKAGHFSFTEDEVIYNRYQLKERLGMGSCGQVFKAIDTCNNEEVAVKIIKAKKGVTMRAQTEIKLLTQMQENFAPSDSSKEHNIVHMLDTFMHRDHQCIVFEPLTITLYQLLETTKFRGLQLEMVRSVAQQLLQALAYLARPDVDIIHCDLKPENVMLGNLECNDVKLIDFGSACKSNEQSHTYIQSRFYRSPEVILGLPYSVAIDMWSLGCMLVELYTGEQLFAGLKDELDMLQRIVAVMGMPPDEMIHQVKKVRQRTFFERMDGGWWAIKQTSGHDASQLIIPSHDPKSSLKDVIASACAKTDKPKENQEDHDSFVDMIFQMLTYQPENRLHPHQALKHPFFSSHRLM
eukprot:CAMPEP_0201739184 /NCGR_PEP_ID=MMETSP0593-20130828/45645_1 /ASSEMBLY_ACC=CAM_ASM_000672 /TAXON_ID=267983 /ORGANISM="Skeletonema japonicum, Strain CCMP2506" /LENGTH=526 /DNA_ID=CAMNT_0048233437 /DNA_START=144 /DNA_END=1724 /DNA_ORIENTATION=+